MARRSLKQEIFRLVVGLVLLTSLTILINVWWATYEQAQQRMSKDIKTAQKVLTTIINNREKLLFTSASVLTEDFGFKQAIASKDEATIVSALSNHGKRISADLMAITNLEGELIAYTLNEQYKGTQTANLKKLPITQLQINKSIEQGGTSSFLILNGRLFKTNMLRIDAPRPIALGLVGFELDAAFIGELDDITQLNVWIQATTIKQNLAALSTQDSSDIITNSFNDNKTNISADMSIMSITNDRNLAINQHDDTKHMIKLDDLGWFDLVFKSDAIVAQELIIYTSSNLEIKVLLTQKLEALIAEFSTLKSSISIIIAIASIFAFFIAALYSRKLARPLSYLSEVAQSISSGNYQKQINTHNLSRELQDLSDAFESMQISISEREKQINHQAQRDPLTDLYTRYHIGNLINQDLEKGKTFQAIGINIVGFRAINDVFGYQYGDVCLTVVAHRLKKLGGIAARLSGGEFLWLPPSPMAEIDIDNIKRQLEQNVVKDDVSIPMPLSLAWVNCPEQAEDALVLLKRINIVLDEAKQANHRLLPFSDSLEQKYERRLQIITKLKRALACNSSDISLAYQPKLALLEQKVYSVEALMRWTDPDYGFIPPDEFIPIAEQSGLISKVTYWVIERAIKDANTMHQNGLDLCIAINLSAKDLADPGLLNKIKVELEAVNLPASALSFEITEGDLVEDAKAAVEQLNAYRRQGHKLAIDDFGTGYSSLGYLKSFPVDTLKIDKSFVLELSHNKDDQDIVQTILQLASKFNLTVVAEGVEDKAALAYLAEHGCTSAQGYYVCRPIPLNDLIDWFMAEQSTPWLVAE